MSDHPNQQTSNQQIGFAEAHLVKTAVDVMHHEVGHQMLNQVLGDFMQLNRQLKDPKPDGAGPAEEQLKRDGIIFRRDPNSNTITAIDFGAHNSWLPNGEQKRLEITANDAPTGLIINPNPYLNNPVEVDAATLKKHATDLGSYFHQQNALNKNPWDEKLRADMANGIIEAYTQGNEKGLMNMFTDMNAAIPENDIAIKVDNRNYNEVTVGFYKIEKDKDGHPQKTEISKPLTVVLDQTTAHHADEIAEAVRQKSEFKPGSPEYTKLIQYVKQEYEKANGTHHGDVKESWRNVHGLIKSVNDRLDSDHQLKVAGENDGGYIEIDGKTVALGITEAHKNGVLR